MKSTESNAETWKLVCFFLGKSSTNTHNSRQWDYSMWICHEINSNVILMQIWRWYDFDALVLVIKINVNNKEDPSILEVYID